MGKKLQKKGGYVDHDPTYLWDNPEKLATLGTQDEEKQSKNTTQLVLNTTNQTQVTQIGHEPSNKQWALQ
jgi:hypothetical protein